MLLTAGYLLLVCGVLQVLSGVAAKHGTTIANVASRWVLQVGRRKYEPGAGGWYNAQGASLSCSCKQGLTGHQPHATNTYLA
jgi:hypothetical protein